MSPQKPLSIPEETNTCAQSVHTVAETVELDAQIALDILCRDGSKDSVLYDEDTHVNPQPSQSAAKISAHKERQKASSKETRYKI